MKIKTKKKGLFIIRRAKSSDKSFNFRECIRLAYFQLEQKKAYIIKRRGSNNVILVTQNKKEAERLLKFLNTAYDKIPTRRKAKGFNPTCVVVDDLSSNQPKQTI